MSDLYSPYRRQDFRALAEAVHLGDCPSGILSDWLMDHGESEHKALEALLPYPPSQYLPRHYYDEGIGSGIGSGSGSIQKEVVLEIGKAYLLETVDWFAWVGRVKRQVGPWEYEFESCSKIAETNNQDNWHDLAAGDKKARKAATYRHYTTPVILGLGVVVKIEWVGATPQEEGLE